MNYQPETENFDKLLNQVIRKFKKGWILQNFSRYGIPSYKWINGKKESNYPRINEDSFCDLLECDIIEFDLGNGYFANYKLKS